MDKQSKIYIAGHTGLAGSAIMRKLAEMGYQNIVYKTRADLDLRRQTEVEKFFKEVKPEYVFIAAGTVGGIFANNTYTAEFIYDNLTIAANIIHASWLYGVKKLLNLSSACIYPKMALQPIKEECLLSGGFEPTNEPYAVAKLVGVKLCQYYNQQYGTNNFSLVPANLYGSNDNFSLKTAHLLPALIRKFYLGRLLQEDNFALISRDFFNPLRRNPRGFSPGMNVCGGYFCSGEGAPDFSPGGSTFGVLEAGSLPKNPDKEELIRILNSLGIDKGAVTLWGSGSYFREFLSADDLAGACVYLMEKYSARDIGEFVNIGFGRDFQIREIAELVKNIVGFRGKIKWDKSRPEGMPRKFLDSSKINALGWKPSVSLEDGIKRLYLWYLKKSTSEN